MRGREKRVLLDLEAPCIAGKCYPLHRRAAASIAAFSFPSCNNTHLLHGERCVRLRTDRRVDPLSY